MQVLHSDILVPDAITLFAENWLKNHYDLRGRLPNSQSQLCLITRTLRDLRRFT
jgi:hypothetical protein